MNIHQVINLLVTITLIEMMVTIGLSVTVADLVSVATRWQFVAKALLANYVVVPALTVGLLLIFEPHPMVAVGFLVLAVCPGAPYGSPLTAIAKGNVISSTGLMVVLAGSSAIVAPPLLGILLKLSGGQDTINLHAARMAGTLLTTQLLPLSLGLAVSYWRPTLAARLTKPASQLSKILNLLTISLIIVTNFSMFSHIRPAGYLGMFILLAVSLAAGWLLGGPHTTDRKSMALTTSLRNAGVGMVIASTSFPNSPVLTTVLAYAIFELIGGLLFAVACRSFCSSRFITTPHNIDNVFTES